MQENKINIKEIWFWLEDSKERLENPCEDCGYYECKNYPYNDLLKKRYAELNIIDDKECLKSYKERLKELNILRRHTTFKEWSYKKCDLCNKKFFIDDLRLHGELETKESIKAKDKNTVEWRSVHCCKKCNKNYIRGKKAFYGNDFEKMIK